MNELRIHTESIQTEWLSPLRGLTIAALHWGQGDLLQRSSAASTEPWAETGLVFSTWDVKMSRRKKEKKEEVEKITEKRGNTGDCSRGGGESQKRHLVCILLEHLYLSGTLLIKERWAALQNKGEGRWGTETSTLEATFYVWKQRFLRSRSMKTSPSVSCLGSNLSRTRHSSISHRLSLVPEHSTIVL